MVVDRPEEIKERGPVLGVVLKILGDHVESALEHGREDTRHLSRHGRLQLVDQTSEE